MNQYHAPNADHIPDALISRRALYRAIERIAGMTVPQSGQDCMGDSVQLPDPKPAEIYAHVLKAIAEVETTAQPSRDLLTSIAFEHKDSNKFEQARTELQDLLRSSPVEQTATLSSELEQSTLVTDLREARKSLEQLSATSFDGAVSLYARAADAIERLQRERVAPQWRPIDTAPGHAMQPEKPAEVYTQEALDAAHARTRERLSKLKIETRSGDSHDRD